MADHLNTGELAILLALALAARHGKTRQQQSLRYKLYLGSPLWRARRAIWIAEAGGRCQRCGSRHRLTIHHHTYKRLGHERASDIAVLCWRCHQRHHARR
jgi:hypothetical protein